MHKKMNYKEALKYSMNLCSRQERCKYEIREKLLGLDMSMQDIEKVMSLLEKESFIDEVRFAGMYASDKLRFNKWGKTKIRYMLNQKKIPGEIIEKALDEVDASLYEEILTEELNKKRKAIKSGNKWDVRNKLYRFARQKGFESDLIQQILSSELP